MDINQRLNKIVHIGQLLPEQLSQPVPFESVELSPEEAELALKEAMIRKHAQLEDDRRKRLALERANDLRRPWSPNELYAYARHRATDMLKAETGNPAATFEPVDFQKDAITALSLYFTHNPEFENLDSGRYNSNPDTPFALHKGLWLWSNPGQGKTLLMNMFSRNKRQCYRVVECPKLVSGYVKFGEDHIERYSQPVQENPEPFNYFQNTSGICYNDLGTEPTRSLSFGNAINVMETIFLDSYERKIPFSHRHVTTNLTFDQVREQYGARFLDRIRQSFNIIQIKGESLRK